MNKTDIKDVELTLKVNDVVNAIENGSKIAIDINGTIYIDDIDPKKPLIFARRVDNIDSSLPQKEKIEKLFGKEYKPLIGDTICIIKPLIAWQEVMKINKDRMFYEDHSTDGIEVFNDKRVEDIAFEAVVFDVDYRDIAQFVEDNCDGEFIYYENEIQFSGFTIAHDNDKAYKQVKEYIQDQISAKVESGELDLAQFDEEEKTAYDIIFKA
jgi:hypothetical protein